MFKADVSILLQRYVTIRMIESGFKNPCTKCHVMHAYETPPCPLELRIADVDLLDADRIVIWNVVLQPRFRDESAWEKESTFTSSPATKR